MARLPDGSWLVSFERHHRIWRYPTLDGTPGADQRLPTDFERQPDNGGVEAMTALADGRIIAISEEYVVPPGTLVGWIGQPAATAATTWQHRSTTPRSPTSTRRRSPGCPTARSRCSSAPSTWCAACAAASCASMPPSFRPGATVHAEELARLASPYAVDNLEGLAATKGARGETLLWLISDDNFNPLQRNMLLLFELAPK